MSHLGCLLRSISVSGHTSIFQSNTRNILKAPYVNRLTTSQDFEQLKTRTLFQLLISNLLTLETNFGLLNLANQNWKNRWKNTVDQKTAVMSLLFGDNLQSRFNDIRALNKISKTTFPQRLNQGKGGRFSNNKNSVSDNKQRRGQNFLSKGRFWKLTRQNHFPGQLKTNSRKRGNHGNQWQ